MMIKVFTDGASRGNPGPASIGVYIEDSDGNVLHEISRDIGNSTNNVAEYTAVLAALRWLLKNKELVKKHTDITMFIDSQLVVSQINGIYKIKKPYLREFILKIHSIIAQLPVLICFKHVPREMNKNADALANKALDNKLI